MNKWI